MDHFFRNIDPKKQQIFLEVLEQMVETLQPDVEASARGEGSEPELDA